MAYSTAASASIPDPKWMAMHFTVDPGVSPTLTASDIGLLLFHKLEFPRNGVILQIDPSAYKVLKIKIPGDYDYSRHLSASGIVLRKGLTVLPMMEARKDKWVRITRLPPEVDNFHVEQGKFNFTTYITRNPFRLSSLQLPAIFEPTGGGGEAGDPPDAH